MQHHKQIHNVNKELKKLIPLSFNEIGEAYLNISTIICKRFG